MTLRSASRLALFGAVALALAMWALWLVWQAPAAGATSSGARASMAQPFDGAIANAPRAEASATHVPPPAAMAATTEPEAAAKPPPGMTFEQWTQLQATLVNHPAREAELARISDYMSFQHDFARFQQLRQTAGAAPAELVAMARSLDTRLSDRLARHEMHAGEARLAKLALLDVLEPDATARAGAATAWAQAESALAARHAVPDTRESVYQAQQQAVVAAWHAQPADRRDPKALEAQLDALRRHTFETPAR